MSITEVRELFDRNWKDCRESVTVLSDSLVQSEIKMFNFDRICEMLTRADKRPASADALRVCAKSVELIEFKRGFRQKISRSDFIKRRPLCQTTGTACAEYDEYLELFFQNRENEISGLIEAIRIKAIESYITFEKQILQKIDDVYGNIPLTLTVVIDDTGIDSRENILQELGKIEKQNVTGNAFERIKSSLSSITNICDCNGNVYCYQNYKVMSADEFSASLEVGIKN